MVRQSLRLPPRHLQRRDGTDGMSEEEPEDWEPTTCEDTRMTLCGGLCITIVINFIM